MSKTATRQMPDGGPPYRLGVMTIILNDKNETLACLRVDEKDWQWPQGGLDEGEDALVTAYREMEEEVGLAAENVEFLTKLPCETTYDFPDYVIEQHKKMDGPSYVMKYRGQIHQWFVFRLTGPESAIQLDKHHEIEFKDWQWLAADKMVEKIVPFKREAYAEAAACLATYLNQL